MQELIPRSANQKSDPGKGIKLLPLQDLKFVGGSGARENTMTRIRSAILLMLHRERADGSCLCPGFVGRAPNCLAPVSRCTLALELVVPPLDTKHGQVESRWRRAVREQRATVRGRSDRIGWSNPTLLNGGAQ